MPKYLGEIAVKRADIAATVQALERNRRITTRIGGTDTVDVGDEIAFQKARLALLDWAITADEAELRGQRQAHLNALPPEAVDVVGDGITRGLPPAVTSRVGYVALLDLCVGEHPAQRQRPFVDAVATAEEIAATIAEVPAVEPEAPDVSLPTRPTQDVIAAPVTGRR